MPKVSSGEEMSKVNDLLTDIEEAHMMPKNHYKTLVQIETTQGFSNMKDIFEAGRPRVVAAAFGADDFLTDFGIKREYNREELDFARKLFALECHAANVVSIDTPYVAYKDIEGLREELRYLRSIGMKAKFAIHPSQIDVINEEFLPSPEEITYARNLV